MLVRLSFGSYFFSSSSAISSGAVSSYAVAFSYYVFYEAVGCQRIYSISIICLVTARSERDSCESYEHEN